MAVKNNGWYPAYLVNKDGGDFKIRYAGSDGEAIVKSEQVRHLFAGKPGETFPRGLFK